MSARARLLDLPGTADISVSAPFEAPESSQRSRLAFTRYLLSCRHKEAYTWTNPMCCVHNIILGKLWIEQYGTVEIINHRFVNGYLGVKSKHV